MTLKFSGKTVLTAGKLNTTPNVVPFTVNAVNFDGSNDYLSRGAGLTGIADSKTFIISFWFNILGGDGLTLRPFGDNNFRFTVFRQGDNTFAWVFRTNTNFGVWNGSTNDQFSTSTNTGWNHWLMSMDAAAATRQLFINDTSASITTTSTADALMDLDAATEWTIGSSTDTTQKWNGDLAEVYLNTSEFLDISVESNRRKFYSSSGKPVDLGADGSTPTGSQPIVFLSGVTDSWHTNKGSGGGFTENSALTTASTSPSD